MSNAAAPPLRKMDNISVRKFSRLLLMVCALMALQGCSHPIGSGSAPYQILILPQGGTLGQGSTRVYQCVPSSLVAVVVFTDGSTGNFTSRVAWASSDPGIVNVSNGNIFDPYSGAAFSNGVLVPYTAGAATVTAAFDGLVGQISVGVGATGDLTFNVADQYHIVDGQYALINVPITKTEIGVGTYENMTLTGVQDGVERNLGAYAHWYTDAAGTVSVGGSGKVQALGIGGPSSVFATLPLCGLTQSVAVTTADVDHLTLTAEYGSDPLIVGNDEGFFTTAHLTDGSTQDVSLQTVLTSSIPAAATFSTDMLSATAADALVNVSGTLTINGNALETPQLSVLTTAANLQSITVTPVDGGTLVAGGDQVVPLKAAGLFDNGQTQDITRTATWTTGSSAIAQVVSGAQLGGQVSASATATTVTGETTVQASKTVNSLLINSNNSTITVLAP